MKFAFTFETLLKYKTSLEDVARRDWAEAQGKVDVAMKELDALYDQVDQSRLSAAQLVKKGGAQSTELILIDEFIKGQGLRIEQKRLKIRELMAIAEAKHDELVEAAKERKKLDKLKEHQFEAFRLRRKKDDAKKLDELVVTRFKRPGTTGAA
jgi:flagellar FliJ protein